METREGKVSKIRKNRRKLRTRRKIMTGKNFPRLSVFRSNTKFYAQIIDDSKGITLVSINEKEMKDLSGARIEKSMILGEELAKKASAKKIKQVVFDKGSYRYHGRVKAFAEGARKGGLQF
jgi:large subunit ribosomal protein L18